MGSRHNQMADTQSSETAWAMQHGKLRRKRNDRDSLFYHGELSVRAIPSMWINIVVITYWMMGKFTGNPYIRW